jgi:hypothetical protein
VLRHEGLADAEREDQLADGRLAPPERVQEVAPTRFGEDLQHVGHLLSMPRQAYVCQDI